LIILVFEQLHVQLWEHFRCSLKLGFTGYLLYMNTYETSLRNVTKQAFDEFYNNSGMSFIKVYT